jgi:hypothetical protein
VAKGVERRHSARLLIPSQFRGHGGQLQSARLLDLSSAGARVEHPAPLRAGLLCVVDLPPALGRGSLSGRVVWSKLHHTEHNLEGERRRYFQSGLAWDGLTPEQLGALTAALELLKAAQEG